jgi:hypothetical protein
MRHLGEHNACTRIYPDTARLQDRRIDFDGRRARLGALAARDPAIPSRANTRQPEKSSNRQDRVRATRRGWIMSTAAHSKAFRKRKVTKSDVTFSVTLMEIIQELRAENSSLRVTLASLTVTVSELKQQLSLGILSKKEEGSDSYGLSSESPPESAPNGAQDLVKVIFDTVIRYLGRYGQTELRARTLAGKWRKTLHDDGRLIAIILSAEKNQPVDPVGYLSAAVQDAARPQIPPIRGGLS